jgi:hypothetical protein
MYTLYFGMFGLALSVLGCMLHAAFNRRWSTLQGGVPLLVVFVLLTLVFGAAK